MNRVFASRLENPSYTYDNEGHLHVPPLQPGRLPPALSPSGRSEPEATAAIGPAKSNNTVSGFFGGMFASNTQPETGNGGSSASNKSSGGFFGSLFGSKQDDTAPVQTARADATAPKSKPHNAIGSVAGSRPKPKAEPPRVETQQADAGKPKLRREQQANATPPENNGGLMSGAQPLVPAGSFDSRWGGLR